MDAWFEIGLLQIGLSNAVIATALAALACFATRVCRRPQVALALWLLVLAKLVSPPLVNLAWPLIPSFAASQSDSPKKAEGSPIALPLVLEDASRPTSNVVDLENHPADAEPLPAPADVGAFVVAPHWVALAGRVWLAGSALWIALAVIRTRRFRRVLRHAQPASPEICDEVARLAKKLALRRPPEVRLVHRRVGPLVWALAGRATILLPVELMDRLTPDQRATVLAHELVHLERGDHRLNWLKLAALGLYWWHPVAWWARRRIEQAKEACCDERVVALLPNLARDYAAALLTTVDFLAEAPGAVPFGANGFSQARLLTRRLEMILAPATSRSQNGLFRWAVLVTALLVLPISIHAVSAESAAEPIAQESNAQQAAADEDSSKDSLEERLDRLEKSVRQLVGELGRPTGNQPTTETKPTAETETAPPADGEPKPVDFAAVAALDLAKIIRQAEAKLEATRTQLARQSAADRQYQAVAAAYEADTVTIDQVLETLRRLKEARVSFARAACELCDDPRERDVVFAVASISAANKSLSEARQTWRRAYEKAKPAPTGQEAAAEAQARELYFQFK